MPSPEVMRSLMQRYPRHAMVPIALVASTILLIRGLSLPLLYTQKMFWKSSYSVWAGVVALWNQQEYLLAFVLLFFSMVFPFIKLASLAIIWFVKLPDRRRTALLHGLGVLGKWSMLDVFVVAILIVFVKLGPLVNVEPRSGVYVFSTAIAASMLTTMYVDRLARKPLRHIPPPSI